MFIHLELLDEFPHGLPNFRTAHPALTDPCNFERRLHIGHDDTAHCREPDLEDRAELMLWVFIVYEGVFILVAVVAFEF